MNKKEARVLETLNKRFAKEEKIHATKRCVYSYYDRFQGNYTDNLILLPYSTRFAHSHVLTQCLYDVYSSFCRKHSIKVEDLGMMIDIHFIGYFDTKKHIFEKKSKKVIVSGKEIAKLINESKGN